MNSETAIKTKKTFFNRKIELTIGLIILAAVFFLHATNFYSGKALLGDEVNTVKLSQRPLLSAIKEDLSYDSFPPFSVVVFHFWGNFTSTDQGYRLLGLIVGLAIIAAFWWNSRALGIGLPVLSWALFELNYVSVRYGDYVRAYSFGVLFILLSYGLIWKIATEKFNIKIFLGAMILAILSVQTMYQNALLIFAICVAGILISLEQRQTKKIWQIFAIGAAAAISLLPYLGFMKRANDWMAVSKSIDNPDPMIWKVFGQAVGASSLIFFFTLIGLIVLSIIIFYFHTSKKDISSDRKNLYGFSIATLIISTFSIVFFLRATRIPIQPHYFITLLAIASLSLETILFVSLPNHKTIIASALGLLLLLTTINPNLEQLQTRTTNIDIIANELSKNANQKDLILLNPWWLGIPFDRYYDGKAAWTTLPSLDDYSIFRYPEIQKKMTEQDPTSTALESMAKTLKSGGRVWLVGRTDSKTKIKPSVSYMEPYLNFWTWQMSEVTSHAQTQTSMDLGLYQRINPSENYPLIILEGWKE